MGLLFYFNYTKNTKFAPLDFTSITEALIVV